MSAHFFVKSWKTCPLRPWLGGFHTLSILDLDNEDVKCATRFTVVLQGSNVDCVFACGQLAKISSCTDALVQWAKAAMACLTVLSLFVLHKHHAVTYSKLHLRLCSQPHVSKLMMACVGWRKDMAMRADSREVLCHFQVKKHMHSGYAV